MNDVYKMFGGSDSVRPYITFRRSINESRKNMRYISELKEGDRVSGIYLCKQKTPAVTRNGKPYENVVLQDKTGSIDCKIWDPNSQGIADFDAMDFVEINGEVTSFSGNLQLNIRRLRLAAEGEYVPSDFMPTSARSIEEMYSQLLQIISTVSNPYLHTLLEDLFVRDEAFIHAFTGHSAAKTVHHSFIGGLLEHTLSVARFCDYMAGAYPLLQRDLLVSAAILHDIGKTRELSAFPLNDYTDEGQLIGHIVIGAQILYERTARIPDFPVTLKNELIHCILAHHGELEYGSPKKPALAEAVALNLADNADARMQTLTELFTAGKGSGEWLGFNRMFDSNLRKTQEV